MVTVTGVNGSGRRVQGLSRPPTPADASPPPTSPFPLFIASFNLFIDIVLLVYVGESAVTVEFFPALLCPSLPTNIQKCKFIRYNQFHLILPWASSIGVDRGILYSST